MTDRKGPSYWKGKTVVVSGGTKGLGGEIAIHAAMQNARLIIVGRDPTTLAEMRSRLKQAGAVEVIGVACNAANIHTSAEFLESISKEGVDLLINAIGRSDRGPLDRIAMEDLEGLFRDNVALGWNVTNTCLPFLEQTQGVVVNIGSLAGLIATPNLGGYCPSKFAWTALTRQWRLELKPRGIHVLLVSPGPIQREDSFDRYDQLIESRGGMSEGVKQPGGGAKLKLIDPGWLSEKILLAASQRTSEIVVPFKARILAALMPLFPAFADYLLEKNLRK